MGVFCYEENGFQTNKSGGALPYIILWVCSAVKGKLVSATYWLSGISTKRTVSNFTEWL